MSMRVVASLKVREIVTASRGLIGNGWTGGVWDDCVLTWLATRA